MNKLDAWRDEWDNWGRDEDYVKPGGTVSNEDPTKEQGDIDEARLAEFNPPFYAYTKDQFIVWEDGVEVVVAERDKHGVTLNQCDIGLDNAHQLALWLTDQVTK